MPFSGERCRDSLERGRRECAAVDPVEDPLLRGIKPTLDGASAAKLGNHFGYG